MSDINYIFMFVLNRLRDIFNMYGSNIILGAVMALYIFGRIVNIIRRVLPHG